MSPARCWSSELAMTVTAVPPLSWVMSAPTSLSFCAAETVTAVVSMSESCSATCLPCTVGLFEPYCERGISPYTGVSEPRT
jgi:hypothetical protein